MTTFKNTSKGNKAEKKYQEMLSEGFSEVGALEILIMHGYRNEFVTDMFI